MRFKIILSFSLYIRDKRKYWGDFRYLKLSLQKSENTVNRHKNPIFCHVFRNKMRCNSGYEWYINKPFCKFLHYIALNKTGKFGVCECNWSGDTSSQVWGKPILKKHHSRSLFCFILCTLFYGHLWIILWSIVHVMLLMECTEFSVWRNNYVHHHHQHHHHRHHQTISFKLYY